MRLKCILREDLDEDRDAGLILELDLLRALIVLHAGFVDGKLYATVEALHTDEGLVILGSRFCSNNGGFSAWLIIVGKLRMVILPLGDHVLLNSLLMQSEVGRIIGIDERLLTQNVFVYIIFGMKDAVVNLAPFFFLLRTIWCFSLRSIVVKACFP